MRYHWSEMYTVLLLVGTLLVVLPVRSFASGTPQRGQFPQCQEECLKRHNEKMHKLAEEYKATGNSLQYQDAVEAQGLEYEKCLDNCRLPYPVK
jgi:hypothetical protein